MNRLKRTQTEESRIIAFSGESQASNRYNYCAGAARKEGLMQLADIFAQTADQEKEYAERFFKIAERVAWRFRNCGYPHEREEAPEVSPACLHPQSHFELLGEQW